LRHAADDFARPEAIAALGPVAHDPSFVKWMTRMMRSSTTPAAFARWSAVRLETDIRAAVPHVRVPVLLMNTAANEVVSAAHTRWLAAHLPDARYVELPGEDYPWWVEHVDRVVDEIEEFVTGERPVVAPDRVLSTVLFTDIVDSTRRAAELGDGAWTRLLDVHDEVARRLVAHQRGCLVKATGDGLMATFDGPARAVRCAVELRDALGDVGLDIRAGVHAGEVELRGEDVGGIAVHIAARVQSRAAVGEILVSRTVVDLVTGSGLAFEPRARCELRGVPGEWELLAVVAERPTTRRTGP
jgi:class 3 adenylate cyclase